MAEWIDVRDKLPREEKKVLCYLDDGEYAVLYWKQDSWADYNKIEWLDGGLGTGSFDVIAWQPLPKPYKRKN